MFGKKVKEEAYLVGLFGGHVLYHIASTATMKRRRRRGELLQTLDIPPIQLENQTLEFMLVCTALKYARPRDAQTGEPQLQPVGTQKKPSPPYLTTTNPS